MTIAERLARVSRVFLDTAPVIYFAETRPKYARVAAEAFELVDRGATSAVTSPVTLAECLVVPFRQDDPVLRELFIKPVLHGEHTEFVPIADAAALRAAALRAQYSLPLADSLQIAVALEARCDAFLTNDRVLRRVESIDVIVLDDFMRTTPA